MHDAPGPLDLFGTAEPAAERRRLVAGPLSVVLEDGNLRDIRFHGVELVRAINYLARDEAWGTYRPVISALTIVEESDRFDVSYRALCGPTGAGFAYAMTIRGDRSGLLTVEADGVALADFRTNRTGFVVLHAAEVAGGRMDIVHTDGRLEKGSFPGTIMADQPAFDIATIIHEPAPGMTCSVEMAGDAFEMEDQRNWADASFKTYVRPLSRPRPYVIAKGEHDRQSIVVRAEGAAPGGVAETRAVALSLENPAGTMPDVALFVDDAGWGEGRALPANLAIVRLDLTQPDAAALQQAAGRGPVAVELVMPARDPAGEARQALQLLSAAGLRPSALLVSLGRDFRTRPSRTLPEGESDTDTLVAALKASGFQGPVGAGTPSYFTEFNRNPPGLKADFVFFSVAGIVHAADDISLAETLDVYPMLVQSARSLCPGLPIWLGPCTIGVRHNPYGSATQPNPANGRVPSATIDPRHGALYGAAYAVGAGAQAALAGVSTVTLGAALGPFGVGGGDGTARPIRSVVSEFAKAAGSACRPLGGGRAGLHGIAWGEGAGIRALLANLTPEAIDLDLPRGVAGAALLCADAEWRGVESVGGRLSLPAWRTALLSA